MKTQTNSNLQLIIILLLASTIALMSFGIVYANEESAETQTMQDAILTLTSTFSGLIQEQQYDKAVELFHYPEDYTVERLKEDQANIQKALELWFNEFGAVKSYERNTEAIVYYSVSVMGGDLKFWEDKPLYTKIIYNTEFEKEGSGLIIFTVCELNGKLKIRSFHYGFLTSKSGARERLIEIMQKMMSLMNIKG